MITVSLIVLKCSGRINLCPYCKVIFHCGSLNPLDGKLKDLNIGLQRCRLATQGSNIKSEEAIKGMIR